MVVLSRAAGIPARLVTGYVAGAYDNENQAFVVTADQAHSWVEIFFPGYGWLPFEPTAGRPAITRQQSTDQLEIPALDLKLEPLIQKTSQKLIGWANWAGLTLLSLLFLGLVGVAGYEWRFVRQPVSQVLPAIISRIYWIGEQIGVRSTRGDTAYEYFSQFEVQIEALPRSEKMGHWLKQGRKSLEVLAEAYQAHLFREEVASTEEKQIIIDAYRNVRLKMLVLWGVTKALQLPLIRHIFRQKMPAEDELITGRLT